MVFQKLLLPAGIVGTVVGVVTLTKDYLGGDRYKGDTKLFGRTVIITGANSGLGEQTAMELAKRGGKIIMACRNMKECAEVRDEIVEKTFNPNVHCKKLDLTSIKSINEFAEDINKNEKRVHILINNAGVMMPDQRKLTRDGYEMHLGVNYLGPFLLTQLLLDKLKASAPSRIVNVTCSHFMHGKIDFKNLNFDKNYRGEAAYGQSKLALYLFSVRLAEMLEGTKVSVYAVNPGLCYTKLPRNMGWYKSYISSAILYPFLFLVMNPPELGMQTILRCALDPELEGHSGKYYYKCQEVENVPDDVFKNVSIDRLWATSELWTRLKTHTELVKTQPDVVKSHLDVQKSSS